MSVSYTTRQSLCSSLSLKRYVSSRAAPLPLSLPPSKLRALISIYHQSAHFITPQNLSAAIDRAFIGDQDLPGTSTKNELNMDQLRKALRRREGTSITGRWKGMYFASGLGELPKEWSHGKPGREMKVVGALYGTDEAGKPGLEVLLEERARLIRNVEEDRE